MVSGILEDDIIKVIVIGNNKSGKVDLVESFYYEEEEESKVGRTYAKS